MDNFWRYFIAWLTAAVVLGLGSFAIATAVVTHEASLRRECFDRHLVYWPEPGVCATPPSMPNTGRAS